MQREIYVVSRCLKTPNPDLGTAHYFFHFKGYLLGSKVTGIKSYHPRGCEPIIGRDYVMKAKVLGMEGNILVVQSLFLKNIDEAQENWF